MKQCWKHVKIFLKYHKMGLNLKEMIFLLIEASNKKERYDK